MAKQAILNINFWDDFYDDDHIPEGKIQETHAYVEGGDAPDQTEKEVLEFIMEFIKEHCKLDAKTEMELVFHDSKLKYPHMIGTEHEWCLYQRWQINFKHLTHESLFKIMEKFENTVLCFGGYKLNIYSES